jgi:hypothetical protein
MCKVSYSNISYYSPVCKIGPTALHYFMPSDICSTNEQSRVSDQGAALHVAYPQVVHLIGLYLVHCKNQVERFLSLLGMFAALGSAC